jgi:uncharacterized protein (DUF2147 family)
MRTILASALILAGGPFAFASDSLTPLGVWARGDGVARVKIEPCGADLCAINTWIKPGVTDEKIGDRLVLSIKAADGKRWSGEAFDPQRNLRFNMSFDVDKAKMESHGCVLGGLLCKSMGWTRLEQE